MSWSLFPTAIISHYVTKPQYSSVTYWSALFQKLTEEEALISADNMKLNFLKHL